MNEWEVVDDLDEHGVNLINLFDRNTNELLVLQEQGDGTVALRTIKCRPEYDGDELTYIDEVEIIEERIFVERTA